MTTTPCRSDRIAAASGLSSAQLQQLTAVARSAARAGGEQLRSHVGRLQQVREKGRCGDLVTEADTAAEAAVLALLEAETPDIGVLAEESGRRPRPGDLEWVVDPLDGTTNFAAGIPYWAISLARFEHGVPVLAVLDVPPLRQRIVAIRGAGAWRNGKPLSPPSLQRHPAGCASLCSRSIGVLQKLPNQRFPGKIRLLGVASLNLVSVAMGQTVAALEATPKIWDLAAAWLVLSELGCPLRWLAREPAGIAAGTDLGSADFPVLAADRPDTLTTFMPWAEALVS